MSGVLAGDLYTARMSTLPPQTVSYSPAPLPRQTVVVTDIDMTIGAMCRFMVKWVIAAIPAAIIVWLMLAVLTIAVTLIFGGLFHGLMRGFPR